MSESLFEFEAVTITRGGSRVLDGATGVIPAGVLTVVAGPSGAGKSTLLRLCNRLEVPDFGRVMFLGSDLADVDPLVLRRRVGMIFQTPVMFPGTVRDNMAVAAPGLEDARYGAALAVADIDPELLGQDADTLSGGEAQRVCLARTLVTEPEVLLMDEPTASVDVASQKRLEATVKDIVGRGMSVVWVTHDLDQLARLADWVVLIDDGAIVGSGPRSKMWPEPTESVLGSGA